MNYNQLLIQKTESYRVEIRREFHTNRARKSRLSLLSKIDALDTTSSQIETEQQQQVQVNDSMVYYEQRLDVLEQRNSIKDIVTIIQELNRCISETNKQQDLYVESLCSKTGFINKMREVYQDLGNRGVDSRLKLEMNRALVSLISSLSMFYRFNQQVFAELFPNKFMIMSMEVQRPSTVALIMDYLSNMCSISSSFKDLWNLKVADTVVDWLQSIGLPSQNQKCCFIDFFTNFLQATQQHSLKLSLIAEKTISTITQFAAHIVTLHHCYLEYLKEDPSTTMTVESYEASSSRTTQPYIPLLQALKTLFIILAAKIKVDFAILRIEFVIDLVLMQHAPIPIVRGAIRVLAQALYNQEQIAYKILNNPSLMHRLLELSITKAYSLSVYNIFFNMSSLKQCHDMMAGVAIALAEQLNLLDTQPDKRDNREAIFEFLINWFRVEEYVVTERDCDLWRVMSNLKNSSKNHETELNFWRKMVEKAPYLNLPLYVMELDDNSAKDLQQIIRIKIVND